MSLGPIFASPYARAMDPYEFCEKFPLICNDELLDDKVLFALIEALDHELHLIDGRKGPFPTFEKHPEVFHEVLRHLIPAIAATGGLDAEDLAYQVARALVEGLEGIFSLESDLYLEAQFTRYIDGIQRFTTTDWILFIDTLIPPQVGDISQSLHRSMRFLWKQMGATTDDLYFAFRNLRKIQRAFPKYEGFMRSLHTPQLLMLAKHISTFNPRIEMDAWTDSYISYLQDLPLRAAEKRGWNVHDLFNEDFKPRDAQFQSESSQIYPGQEQDLGRTVRLRFLPQVGEPITVEGIIQEINLLTLVVRAQDGQTFTFNHNWSSGDPESIHGSFDFLFVKNRILNYRFEDFIEDLLMSYSRRPNIDKMCPFFVGD